MLAIGQTSICFSNIGRYRSYRRRKAVVKKPCMENPTALDCAVRHRRCQGCPFNYFFRPDKVTKPEVIDLK